MRDTNCRVNCAGALLECVRYHTLGLYNELAMQVLTLVTGNEHKRREWRRLVPPSIRLETVKLDIDELQSFDVDVIIADKARRAYEQTGRPVVVEDVAAGLDGLRGLPGPFIRYFEERLGHDALFQLAGRDRGAAVSCTIAYYDGRKLLLAHGRLKGEVVPARGRRLFGFDCVFVPDGQTKTFAEMTPDEKDALSHRSLAVKDLLAQLKEL